MIPEKMRYQGCMIGLAAGDALGTTVEFKAPGRSSEIGTSPFGFPQSHFLGENHEAVNSQTDRKKVIFQAHVNLQQGRNGPRMKQDEGRPDQKRNFIPPVAGHAPPLGKALKGRHAHERHAEDHKRLGPTADAMEYQIRIEHKHKGNATGSNIV